MSTLKISTTPKHEISPYLYMQFMEPLGTADPSVDTAWDFIENCWDERAMEIIYAINTDDILHNYLQYGVQDTNYTINQTTGLIDHSQINPDNKYYMNSIYTGDIFRIHANETWNDVDKVNGKIQNDQSRVYKSSDN